MTRLQALDRTDHKDEISVDVRRDQNLTAQEIQRRNHRHLAHLVTLAGHAQSRRNYPSGAAVRVVGDDPVLGIF